MPHLISAWDSKTRDEWICTLLSDLLGVCVCPERLEGREEHFAVQPSQGDFSDLLSDLRGWTGGPLLNGKIASGETLTQAININCQV